MHTKTHTEAMEGFCTEDSSQDNTSSAQEKKRRRSHAAPSRSMQQDMLRMMGDPSFSDMLFLCGPMKTELPASRMLVAARSPVLEKMLLRPGMAETKQTNVSLPEIEPTTMHICLEFLYTDAVQDSSWLSIETCMKVVSAADSFEITKLVERAVSRLKPVHWTGDDEDDILLSCDESTSVEDLVKAYSYGVELLHTHPGIEIDALLKTLSYSIYAEECWVVDCHRHLSERGLVHLLKNLHVFEMGHVANMEYILFCYLVRWCLSRVLLRTADSHEEQKIIQDAVSTFLPPCWQWFKIPDKPSSDFEDASADIKRVIKLLADELSDVLPRMPIYLSRMPTSILCTAIEPLQIVPSSILLGAYRLQALSKVDVKWDEFGCGDNYQIGEDGNDDYSLLICKSEHLFQGFARSSCLASFSRDESFYWEIVMLTPCENLRVGFCKGGRYIAQEHYNECLVGDLTYSVALSSDGILHRRTIKKETRRFCTAFVVVQGIRLGVRIGRHSCSFLINGNKVGECCCSVSGWIDNAKVYPAISMQTPGRAQIKLVTE